MKNKISVTFKKFDSCIIPVDKLSTLLFDADVDGLDSIIEDPKNNIESPVKIIYPRDEHGKQIILTPFEKKIFCILLSAQNSGNNYISYSKLFHLLGGGTDIARATSLITAIDTALWKLRCTDLTVNLTDIVSARKKYASKLNVPYNRKDKTKILWRGVLLPNEVLTASINGKISESVIHFLDKSILFDIADLKDQIARVDLKLLQVPIRTTEQTINLSGYLLERIIKIKGSIDKAHVTKLEHSISLNTLYKQCGIPAEKKEQRQTIRRNILKIMDFFKKKDFISDYNLVKNGIGELSIKIFF